MFITRNLDEFLKTHGCEFLKELIACMQERVEVSVEEFQVWRLKRKHKNKYILILDDGNYNKIKTLVVTIPNCSVNKLKLYFENDTLTFPNER
ncbi:DUF6876 family protein [Chryseobacterium nematophagum]|nr:DUF6876 family protein [Chryseobacterium nematophagum]